jgi:hypothetical protein
VDQETIVKDPASTPPLPQPTTGPRKAPPKSIARRFRDRITQQSRGTVALNLSLAIVTGYAVGALMGWVTPLAAAVVGMGAQVLGTIAFFVSYLIGSDE